MDLNEMARALKDNRDVRSAANSAEAKKLLRKLDTTGLEQAVKQGDSAAMREYALRVLSTEEGKALAERLRKAVRQDG